MASFKGNLENGVTSYRVFVLCVELINVASEWLDQESVD